MEMTVVHDSQSLQFRRPFGAVPSGTEIYLTVEIQGAVEVVFLQLWQENGWSQQVQVYYESEGEQGHRYGIHLSTQGKQGLLWYYFVIHTQEGTWYYGNNANQWGGVGQLAAQPPPPYQITLYDGEAGWPKWFTRSLMYQIFPDRFYKSNLPGEVCHHKKNAFFYSDWQDRPMYIKDSQGKIQRWEFFGGNLEGIIAKLPYLEELGVSVLYLNPIFESPSNHRYDTSDYKKIDPMLGDEETFERLVKAAGEKGIAIILDGVFSHTGSDSIYFNKEGRYPEPGAYQSQDSPYYEWFQFDRFPDEYDCWWGVETMPNVNELVPSYMNYMIYDEDSVLRHWMKKGIKGWRLDVVDELPGPFIKAFRQVMKEIDPESVLIGEVWEDASNKISYQQRREYLLGHELDSTMNYPFRKIALTFFIGDRDGADTAAAFRSLQENYPIHHFYSAMNLIGSHDVSRILTALKERYTHHHGVALLKLMVLFQMTFPGVPSIYYGDEAGLEGGTDPENRAPFPWGNQHQELLDWYRRLTRIRNRWPVFQRGELAFFHARGDVLVYRRDTLSGQDVFGDPCERQLAYVLINRNSYETQQLALPAELERDWTWIDLTEGERPLSEWNPQRLSLLPLEGKILLGTVKK